MPREVYQQLDERGRHLCRLIVADPDEKLELGWKAGGARSLCLRVSVSLSLSLSLALALALALALS